MLANIATVVTEIMSDGSKAFNVEVEAAEAPKVIFGMPDRSSAEELARQINDEASWMTVEAEERAEPEDPNEQDDCAHEWVHTGAAYGGDDESYHGEGRVYCSKCGADGDA